NKPSGRKVQSPPILTPSPRKRLTAPHKGAVSPRLPRRIAPSVLHPSPAASDPPAGPRAGSPQSNLPAPPAYESPDKSHNLEIAPEPGRMWAAAPQSAHRDGCLQPRPRSQPAQETTSLPPPRARSDPR